MDSILAAKVLMSHLPNITDGAYKTATEIAIETLLQEAKSKWDAYSGISSALTVLEYMELTQEQYDYWLLGKRGENS